MILIFDYFETLLNTKSMDFNRCLYEFWKDYYQDKCPFEAMKKYGEDLFQVLMEKHKNGEEYPFVKEELPLYAQKFGGDKVDMNAEEEADFLMQCNEFELDPEIERFLQQCSERNIPMYVLSNSGFRAESLMVILNRFGIEKYFKYLWSSADFGRIKPCREFFELAIETALEENPEEIRENIVFIGDIYETDVVGAHQAGIKSAWLNKKDRSDENGWATYNCTSASQLSKILEGEYEY
ncbi:MAG: HAD family hydrolase [Clostridiales bacterium]|nr:HAD family hydrolase [Clostridiales bacterium]